MIRGAGDILGPEQSGFIDSIGFDMYLKLLNEAVQDKLNGQVKEETITFNNNLNVNAYIPSYYANDSDKIALYQEISTCENLTQLDITKQKIIDIYGKLPAETELLFKKKEVDILLRLAEIQSMNELKDRIDLTLGNNFTRINGIGNMLFESLLPFISFTKISYRNKEFQISMDKRKDWIDYLISLLKSILSIYSVNKLKEEIV